MHGLRNLRGKLPEQRNRPGLIIRPIGNKSGTVDFRSYLFNHFHSCYNVFDMGYKLKNYKDTGAG
jgi:hypothetical protein